MYLSVFPRRTANEAAWPADNPLDDALLIRPDCGRATTTPLKLKSAGMSGAHYYRDHQQASYTSRGCPQVYLKENSGHKDRDPSR